MPLTSLEATLPNGVGCYFLSGHRRLPEKLLPSTDATLAEADGP